ncbi:hypothetical protein [Myxacorys almedinensis]|uniref:Uncharacterized protein n=1 Tax=Myxacorys almedinensis A TaxID=2690445 RepID=A0A8J7Z691_9CYAN|nr:hypothetical protein [Myxacorys almedinensis]NDJ18848.1 hypothetical protein [Myxacorys almedinensis A]
MKTQLTTQDLSLLEGLRVKRLRQRFTKSLGLCALHLEGSDTLIVHCPEPWIVDRLLNDLDRLLKAIWIVAGIKYVSICYAEEEIYRAKTRSIRQRYLSQSGKGC